MRKDSTKIVITFVVLIFLLIISISVSVLYTVNNYLDAKRSNVPVFVFFKGNVTKDQAINYTNSLETYAPVKSIRFIDKSTALSDILSKLNLPQSSLSENPLPYSLEVFLKPKFAADQSNIDSIEKTLKKSDLVDEVRIPKGLFTNIIRTYSAFKEFSFALLGIFLLLEIVILALLLKIAYEKNVDSYNKLKLFGVKRSRIFFMFLKQAFLSGIIASVLAIIIGALGMFFYINYVNIVPNYTNDILFSFGISGLANIILSLIIITILSLFVFFIEDEKI
ncbi:MAG TPA: FtsX-like permease family protein [Desulfurella acetivorans]|uniref:Cell division protein FtsX n=1 Tax=Desulfurella acetivorans TaxID=33002 RepID=A0A7C6A6R1_DESAE|nr:FtsX-like permease family protein [Desulfurella acetivorans]